MTDERLAWIESLYGECNVSHPERIAGELLAEVRRLRAEIAGYRSAIARLLEFFERDNPGVLADAYSILKGADHAKA